MKNKYCNKCKGKHYFGDTTGWEMWQEGHPVLNVLFTVAVIPLLPVVALILYLEREIN